MLAVCHNLVYTSSISARVVPREALAKLSLAVFSCLQQNSQPCSTQRTQRSQPSHSSSYRLACIEP